MEEAEEKRPKEKKKTTFDILHSYLHFYLNVTKMQQI